MYEVFSIKCAALGCGRAHPGCSENDAAVVVPPIIRARDVPPISPMHCSEQLKIVVGHVAITPGMALDRRHFEKDDCLSVCVLSLRSRLECAARCCTGQRMQMHPLCRCVARRGCRLSRVSAHARGRSAFPTDTRRTSLLRQHRRRSTPACRRPPSLPTT